MKDVKNVNIVFDSKEMAPWYNLKHQNGWTWEEMCKVCFNYYIKNNPSKGGNN